MNSLVEEEEKEEGRKKKKNPPGGGEGRQARRDRRRFSVASFFNRFALIGGEKGEKGGKEMPSQGVRGPVCVSYVLHEIGKKKRKKNEVSRSNDLWQARRRKGRRRRKGQAKSFLSSSSM